MAIAAATVSATGGITGKVCLGTIIGSALGFVAGNISRSDSAIGRRFGDHLNRMAKDFMADEGLDIDLFKDIDESYKPNNNYIDYKTSRRQFQSNQEDFKYEEDKEYEGTKYYKGYNRYNSDSLRYDRDSDRNINYRDNYNSNRRYDRIDNYTNRYDNYDNYENYDNYD